ncbi:MAG: hypothetical protein E4G98_05475 [Promethearchaeota archaeon]|nr:MAG: hypothetical protein E4G98_05475 [Candidatus Lokiarchaeota archaeon]
MVVGMNNPTPQDNSLSGNLEHSSSANNSLDLPPFLAAFEHIQQRLGGIMGIIPGDELLTAVHVVKDLGTPLRLIDLPIQETVERIVHLQTHSPEEQNAMMQELSLENLPADQDEIHNLFHLLENPEAMKALLTEFRAQFPELTKILVDDRNAYMVSQIKDYHTLYPFKKILVICGALHVTGIVSSLQSWIHSDSNTIK